MWLSQMYMRFSGELLDDMSFVYTKVFTILLFYF